MCGFFWPEYKTELSELGSWTFADCLGSDVGSTRV